MIHVGHVFKRESHVGRLIYVGRKSSVDKISGEMLDMSILGNRFYMPSEAKRDEVCDMYAEWLIDTFIKSMPIAKAINDILDIMIIHPEVTLLCWCWPKRCHANELVKFINSIR